MAFCPKCGAQLAENTNFCPVCGTSISGQSNNAHNNTSINIDNDKLMGVLSYIGPLVLIPIFAAPNSSFARFHANQGLLLFICEIALSIVHPILSAIFLFRIFFALNIIISIFAGLLGLGIFALAVYGVINAAKGEEKELPVIGKIRILK